MAFAQGIHSKFSFKTFMVGLLGVVFLYALLFLYLFLVKDKTLESLEERLASQTILIDRDDVDAPIAQHHQAEVAEQQQQIDEPEEQTSLEELVGQQAKSLREAPVPGFFEDTKYGKLPIAKSPMQTPFQIYKKPFVLNRSKPFIAVAMQNFGLSKELSEAMIAELPSGVSFILSPYSAHPEEWVKKAREDGHEVWLHMPIENNRFPMDDPGAKGLLTRVSLQYNKDRLKWILGRATGYAGIASFTDSALSNSGAMFKNMARDTFGRGLGFLELNTKQDSFFQSVAKETETPYAQNSAFIDVVNPQDEKLRMVQTKIELNGGAIITVSPSPRSIPSLKKWLEVLEKRGTKLTPVSALADPDIERN